jgi:hypothetical protein
MRSRRQPVTVRGRRFIAGALLLACAGCAASGGPAGEATPAAQRTAAYEKLVGTLEPFQVSGGVRTHLGQVLPETIVIEIRSEVCVESRAPGARFWSLDYDTCFVRVSRDTVSRRHVRGQVPCLDATARINRSTLGSCVGATGPVTTGGVRRRMEDGTCSLPRAARSAISCWSWTRSSFSSFWTTPCCGRGRRTTPRRSAVTRPAPPSAAALPEGLGRMSQDGRIGWRCAFSAPRRR